MNFLKTLKGPLGSGERILFFSVDPTKSFTHFHWKKKTYLLSPENIKKLPKSFMAIFSSTAESISHEDLSATDGAIIDSYRGEVVYITYDPGQVEDLERILLKYSKLPTFYPSLAFLRRLSDGVYFEIYWIGDVEKWLLVNYSIEDGDFKGRPLPQIFPAGSEDELLAEITSVLRPLPPDSNVYIYAEKREEEFAEAVEERFRSAGRMIEVQILQAAPWQLAPKKGIAPVLARRAEAEKKRLKDAAFALSALFLFFLASGFEMHRYFSLSEEYEQLSQRLVQIKQERQRVEKELQKLSPFLAYALPKKTQPRWKDFFYEVARVTPRGSKLLYLRVQKEPRSLKWKYELLFQVEDLKLFKRQLDLNLEKYGKFLKNARKITVVTATEFRYRLKGTISARDE